MSSFYEIPTPDGRRYKVYYHEGQNRNECLEMSVLRRWSEYCEKNWLSDNHEAIDAPEKKVKRFLDSCAYFVLRPDTEGIETDYQKEKRGMCEISLSSLPASYTARVYGGNAECTAEDKLAMDIQLDKTDRSDRLKVRKKAVRRKHKETKFDRVQQVKRSHPGCIITSAVVNTDCVFTYSGKSYAINESVAEYQGVQTKYGICYDMDRVIIVQDEAHTWFFTDAMHEITDMVEVLS